MQIFSSVTFFSFPLRELVTCPTLFFFNLNLVATLVNGHFKRCMLKHTKRQVRYYKSQLYNAFVISDVCNSSLCVIPFKTKMAKNQEHFRRKLSLVTLF